VKESTKKKLKNESAKKIKLMSQKTQKQLDVQVVKKLKKRPKESWKSDRETEYNH